MHYKSEVYGPEGMYAKVVLDHISPDGIRLVTLETCAPKFIDAEFEKHRMLSSNSSSTRAIPIKTALLKANYLPSDLRKNERGMQGYEKLSEKEKLDFNSQLWDVKDVIEAFVERWMDKVHKQHLGRYFEAFTLQKKVVTATEWDNFFRLRIASDTQPEMLELARLMKQAMEMSVNEELLPGSWHLPYITDEDYGLIETLTTEIPENVVRKISAARCARVSYMNHDQSNPDVEKDLGFAEKLMLSMHMTPFEHQATPMPWSRESTYIDVTAVDNLFDPGVSHLDKNGYYWSGNFKGWIQNRKLVELDNDKRLG